MRRLHSACGGDCWVVMLLPPSVHRWIQYQTGDYFVECMPMGHWWRDWGMQPSWRWVEGGREGERESRTLFFLS